MVTQTDDELIELLKENNKWAFEAIYCRYQSILITSANKVLNDEDGAEDAVHEVFVQLWLRRETLQINSLSSYLYACVRHQVLKIIKSTMISENIDLYVENLKESNSIEGRLNENDIRGLLKEQVGLLPDKCRVIFDMSRNHYFSRREIAAILNIAPKTVENQLTIALRRLRSSLREFL